MATDPSARGPTARGPVFVAAGLVVPDGATSTTNEDPAAGAPPAVGPPILMQSEGGCNGSGDRRLRLCPTPNGAAVAVPRSLWPRASWEEEEAVERAKCEPPRRRWSPRVAVLAGGRFPRLPLEKRAARRATGSDGLEAGGGGGGRALPARRRSSDANSGGQGRGRRWWGRGRRRGRRWGSGAPTRWGGQGARVRGAHFVNCHPFLKKIELQKKKMSFF